MLISGNVKAVEKEPTAAVISHEVVIVNKRLKKILHERVLHGSDRIEGLSLLYLFDWSGCRLIHLGRITSQIVHYWTNYHLFVVAFLFDVLERRQEWGCISRRYLGNRLGTGFHQHLVPLPLKVGDFK